MSKNTCYFSKVDKKPIDYKDVDLLKKFISPHARIQGKKHTGVCSKHQRELATAIKRARFMGLLPFVKH